MSIQLKKKQHILLGITVGVIVVVIAVLAIFGKKAEKPKIVDKPKFTKHTLASPISAKTNESHWIEKTQNAWKKSQEKSEMLDKNIKTLSLDKDKQAELISAQRDELSEMKSMLKELKAQVVSLKAERANAVPANPNSMEPQNGLLPRADDSAMANSLGMDTGFIQYSATLRQVKKPRVRTAENYVFSNTFVKAVALSGADASAGVLGQSNPDVMIFQLIEDGVMPNKHKSRLRNCFVSASVVGDISSERGKFRTERLSCIHADGTSIDTQVTGIISDSKNGIRGRPVWRDGPMVKKAFWGGFWESMGNVGQQIATDVSVSPLGSVSTVERGQIPLAAVSSGGSGAAKMYAQYNIKRAEMYHPIIQLPPGTIVDVTFLKGFWLDGGTDSKAPEQAPDNPRSSVEADLVSQNSEERAAQDFLQIHSF
jgi:conjugal transfer pilus assembly protein TraB